MFVLIIQIVLKFTKMIFNSKNENTSSARLWYVTGLNSEDQYDAKLFYEKER